MVLGNQLEAFANGRQHAESKAIHFQDAESVQVVFVPLDDRALGHGGIFNRNQLRERPAGNDEAADVLRQVPGET